MKAATPDPFMADYDGPPDERYFAERDKRMAEQEGDWTTDVSLGLPPYESLGPDVGGPQPEWEGLGFGPRPPDAHGLSGSEVVDDGSFAARLGIQPLADIPVEPPLPLLLGRLDPEGQTILYGPGGIGKGALASNWVVSLVHLGHRVLILDYEDRAKEWRRRITALVGSEVAEAVDYVSPTSPGFGGKHGPIWHHADDLRRAMDELGATIIVVDSISMACGGEDAAALEAATKYHMAVASFERPVLSLAHVTKAEDLRYPFGSVFWANYARLTWSLSSAKGGALLKCRKANNYPIQPSALVDIDWRDGALVGVTESPYRETVIDMALATLEDGPLEFAVLLGRINEGRGDDEQVKEDTLRKTLTRAKKDGLVERDGRTWSRT